VRRRGTLRLEAARNAARALNEALHLSSLSIECHRARRSTLLVMPAARAAVALLEQS
jgi:hypothetical protein